MVNGLDERGNPLFLKQYEDITLTLGIHDPDAEIGGIIVVDSDGCILDHKYSDKLPYEEIGDVIIIHDDLIIIKDNTPTSERSNSGFELC